MSLDFRTSKTKPTLPRQVIAPLCQPFSRQADQILDLYEMTQPSVRKPGRCLRCFYDLLSSSATPQKMAALSPLREWIEENLEIAVSEQDAHEAGTIPVRLEQPDLESFCESAMLRARETYLSQARNVLLEIRYKLEAA